MKKVSVRSVAVFFFASAVTALVILLAVGLITVEKNSLSVGLKEPSTRFSVKEKDTAVQVKINDREKTFETDVLSGFLTGNTASLVFLLFLCL